MARALKGTVWSAFYRISALGIAFLISVVSARLLGIANYGALQFVLSITQLAQLGLGLGMATLVMRASGEEEEGDDPRPLNVMIQRAVTMFVALMVLVSLPGLALWVGLEGRGQLVLLAAAAAFSVTQHLVGVYRSALVGKSRFMAAGFGEFLAGVAALVLLGALLLLSAQGDLGPATVLLVRTATSALGTLFLYLSWSRARAGSGPGGPALFDRTAIVKMVRAGVPIALVGAGAVMNSSADIILLGLMRTTAEVGRYHVATRASALIGLPLAVMMVPFSPIISRLHRTDRRELRAVYFRTTALVGASSLGVALLLIEFMGQVLSLFGTDFRDAGRIAIALGIVQLINAAMGPTQQLLIMTGHENIASRAMFAGVTANIVLNLILIPPFGALGAAVGTSVGIALNSLLNAGSVWRHLFSEAALATSSAGRSE